MANRTIYWFIICMFVSQIKGQSSDLFFSWKPLSQHISAYQENANILEYSIPDMYTFSHLRFYWNLDSNHSIAFGVGAISLDMGYLYRFIQHPNHPVLYLLTMGGSVMGGWYFDHSLSFGLVRTKKVGFSLDLGGGYQTEGFQFPGEKYYFAPDVVLTMNAYQFLDISLSAGLHFYSSVKNSYWRKNIPKSGHQFGLSIQYKF